MVKDKDFSEYDIKQVIEAIDNHEKQNRNKRVRTVTLVNIVAIITIIGGIFIGYAFVKQQGIKEKEREELQFDNTQQKDNWKIILSVPLATKKELNEVKRDYKLADSIANKIRKSDMRNIENYLKKINTTQNIILNRFINNE